MVRNNSSKKKMSPEARKELRKVRAVKRHEKVKEITQKVEQKAKTVAVKSWSWVHHAGAGFWILLVFLAVLVLAFSLNLEVWVMNVVLDYGLVAIFLISFLSELLIQPVGPDIPLVLGVLFTPLNPWLVLLCVLAGSWLSLYVAYKIGMKIGKPGIQRLVGMKRWQKVEENDHYGKWILFFGSLTPVPYIPYLTGLFKLSFKEVVLYVVLPRTFRFFVELIGCILVGDLMVRLFLPI